MTTRAAQSLRSNMSAAAVASRRRVLEIESLEIGLRGAPQPLVGPLDLYIDRGETLCLVGESGSGKSLTALGIMGLLGPAFEHPAGSMRLIASGTTSELLTLSATGWSELRGSRMGMIFQEPMTSLNPVVPVGAQIEEALRLHRVDLDGSARSARVLEVLELVQLPDPARIARSFPHQLSGGQRQRVMIAMALVAEPDLLVADEPTTALDVTVQAEILKLIADLQQRNGMAVLLITHDFGVVAQVADRVAVMHRGQLVEQGRRDTVLFDPREDYTRGLIAALPENLPQRPRRAPGECLLRGRDLAVHFPVLRGLMRRQVDAVRAVDGVNLELHAGEVLALVGESGCGKTTLGRALLGLQKLTAGSLQLFGVEMARQSARDWRALRRRIQVVFQDPQSSLNPRLTVGSLLLEPMEVHGIGASASERERIARETLRQVDLPADSLDRFPHEFSGGQRQRIGIAKALVLDPDIIVCDEITSALDVSVQAEILGILVRLLQERGIALVFITHNMAVVEYLADRLLVMHAGRVVEAGDARSVVSAPQDDYTRRLLAAVPRLAASGPGAN